MVKIWFASAQKSADGSGVEYVPQDGYVTIDGKKVHSGDSVRLPEDGGSFRLRLGTEGRFLSG